jgi:hypothetical protein
MDLEQLGAPGLAEQFTRWDSEYSGDPAPAALRHHYVAYRATVRAKVACIRARQGDSAAAGEARHLVAAAQPTPARRRSHPGAGRRATSHRQVRSGRHCRGPARVDGAQQRPDPQGTGRNRATSARPQGLRHRHIHPLVDPVVDPVVDRADLRRDAQPRRTALPPTSFSCDAAPRQRSLRAGLPADQETSPTPRRRSPGDWLPSRRPWPEATVIGTGESGDAGGSEPDPVWLALEAIRPHGPDYVWRPIRPYMAPD